MNEELIQVENWSTSSLGSSLCQSSSEETSINSDSTFNHSISSTKHYNLRRAKQLVDANRTPSLPSLRVIVKDYKTELLNSFSDGDLLSSPDFKRRRKGKLCKLCSPASEEKLVGNQRKSGAVPLCSTKLETVFNETMARSRSQSFNDTPDHLYGLDKTNEFSLEGEADISVGKSSPCKKELTIQTLFGFAAARKLSVCVPLGVLLLACLLGLLLKLHLPTRSIPNDNLAAEKSQQEIQKSDISQELKEIKEELSLLSSKLNWVSERKSSTGGELTVRNTCNPKRGASCSGDIKRVLENMVEHKLEEALETFTADRIGLPDYALDSNGGEIHNGYHSPSYEQIVTEVKYFGWPIWNQVRSPKVVIQSDISPGNCWPFKGQEGFVVIKLSLAIIPSSFTLEHIPASLSPRSDGNIPSAPKDFSVWGWTDPAGKSRDLLGTYQYLVPGKSLQNFKIQDDHNQASYRYVELHVSSNHGQPLYTCIYRFRVHGKPVDSLPTIHHVS